MSVSRLDFDAATTGIRHDLAYHNRRITELERDRDTLRAQLHDLTIKLQEQTKEIETLKSRIPSAP